MHLNVAPLICSVLAALNVTLIATPFAVFSAAVLLYKPPAEIVLPVCNSFRFTICAAVDPGLLYTSTSELMPTLLDVTAAYPTVVPPNFHLYVIAPDPATRCAFK